MDFKNLIIKYEKYRNQESKRIKMRRVLEKTKRLFTNIKAKFPKS